MRERRVSRLGKGKGKGKEKKKKEGVGITKRNGEPSDLISYPPKQKTEVVCLERECK